MKNTKLVIAILFFIAFGANAAPPVTQDPPVTFAPSTGVVTKPANFITANGLLTGNQTVTLSGAVTGSGTTAITTTLAAGQAQSNLAGGSGTLALTNFSSVTTGPLSSSGTISGGYLELGTGLNVSGGSSSIIDLDVSGGLSVTSGGIAVDAGGLTVAAGDLTLDTGSITLAVGDITLDTGAIHVTAGSLTVNGDISSTAGTVYATSADVGSLFVGAGGVVTTGNVSANYLEASAGISYKGEGVANGVTLSDSSIIAEGSTADGFSGTLAFPDVTATRTWTMLNASGLVPLITSVPATATSTGIAGQIAYDASFFYVCTAANTWRRAAIATW